jgi:hypothetical protein
MIFDRTCRGPKALPGLSHAWTVGGALYQNLSWLDARRGISSWIEGLRWLAEYEPSRPIAEIQFWGHGKWGNARVGTGLLDRSALAPRHPLRGPLDAVRDRLTTDALWWFRTCETFGALPGHDFARAWTDFFGGRAAGHTFVIAAWQSGLHGLRAGNVPTWPLSEGLRTGTPDAPTSAHPSRPWLPHTIHCLESRVPPAWFE